jgi:hypothetical protein
VQEKLLGANANRWYGIEPKIFVTEEAPPIDRPDWFPQGAELEEFSRLVAYPRKNAAELKKRGWDHDTLSAARMQMMMEKFSEMMPAESGGGY